jgi:hypothetical protein
MIINSVGNTVPPVFIFPRARLHDSVTPDAPAGTLGLANYSSKQLDHRTSILENP